MKGAHGQWDFENKLQRYLRMKSAGWAKSEIAFALDASSSLMYRIEKAAHGCNRKAAKKNTHNCIVNVKG
jgi:transcriptional regulator